MIDYLNNTELVIAFIAGLIVCIYLIVLLILIIRFYSQAIDSKKKIFNSTWEEKIFDYLSIEEISYNNMRVFSKANQEYLLKLLRSFLLTLQGSEWHKISGLVNDTRLYNYLINCLNSYSKKKTIFAAYYLGIAGSVRAKEELRKKLKYKNEMVFLACAISLARLNDVESLNKILKWATEFKDLNKDIIL